MNDEIKIDDKIVYLNRRAGSPLVRTPSPRRRNNMHPVHDIGFSDTVSNVVEIVKEERGNHRGYRQNANMRYPRGKPLSSIKPFQLLFIGIERKPKKI